MLAAIDYSPTSNGNQGQTKGDAPWLRMTGLLKSAATQQQWQCDL
jgi:hypothetical protein